MLKKQIHGISGLPWPAKLWKAGRNWIFGSGCPISRLSPDTQRKIFLWCLADSGSGFQPESATEPPHLRLEPLTLSHVSSQWRALALSTPSLWSTIWIDRPRQVHIFMVELWLERSQDFALTIDLRQTATPPVAGQPLPEDSEEFEATEQILLLLVQHIDRWKRVTFLFFKGTQHALLLHIPETLSAAPQLEHVHLCVEHWDPHHGKKVERIIYSLPTVNSVVIHRRMSQEFIRWENLAVLNAQRFPSTISSYLHILQYCLALRHAKIRCAADPGVTKSAKGRLCLPHLSSFTIHADGVDLRPLFDGLTLPLLARIALGYTNAPPYADDPHALAQLLSHSACTLKHFRLHHSVGIAQDAHILAFLALPQMAGLAELYLKADLTNNIIRFLTLPSAGDDVSPCELVNLSRISLIDRQGEHIEDLLLYRMVVLRLARAKSRRVLHDVYICMRLQGHSRSASLPWLVERCREQINLRIYLAHCDDQETKVGWYTSVPIPGGYLPED